ncbi:26S proteasome subunit RPN7-domain-containing protein [Pelagophyceae sp. CCMP2097]|nr:26S proteasome subunit RPN7-domain-containing protein [Pelagophyceae sp. CCMP2097]
MAVFDDPAADGGEPATFPDMTLAQKAFLLERLCAVEPDAMEDDSAATAAREKRKADVVAELRAAITKRSMAPFYEATCARFRWDVDAVLLAKMRSENAAELLALEAKHADAVANHGDMEVLDALFEVSRFHARIGAQAEAYAACDVIKDKPKISTGKRIDALMEKVRVALFYGDAKTISAGLATARDLVSNGGDWDRNNRLSVYESVHCIINRDMSQAANKLLNGVATFTCTELCTYPEFVFFAVVTNILTLGRPELKKKIIDGPDILQIIRQIPHLYELVTSLYDCEYECFFRTLLCLHDQLLEDRFFAAHSRFLIREMRVLVYTQFLDAYKSVTLDAMAEKFGVSVPFLDRELAHFISCGRLNAKIDKVGRMVETNRPDYKSAQYQSIIKQGDVLLNRIQKLARRVSI